MSEIKVASEILQRGSNVQETEMRHDHLYLESLGGSVVAVSEVAHNPHHSVSASSLVVERCTVGVSGPGFKSRLV
ncbi:hypothetical protein E2C01_077721 [Portunus trituberculatus]|uniref:Uncharacterized protein n=1 Tax=Portunus trituberculatus TaxID=210409 RepID=A0A5B7IGR2_PORTR|nr:hypothetical protein [Portunus trituberculatus]